jgi:hypothetical protein
MVGAHTRHTIISACSTRGRTDETVILHLQGTKNMVFGALSPVSVSAARQRLEAGAAKAPQARPARPGEVS